MPEVNTNDLFQALHRMNRQMKRYAHHNMFKKNDLHQGQAHLLGTIAENDGLSQGELSEILDIRPSSTTEAVLKMEKSGWIERRQDEKDQRVMRIYITAAGKELAVQVSANSGCMADALFAVLTEEEKSEMLALMGKVADSLEAADIHGGGFGGKGHNCHQHHHFFRQLQKGWKDCFYSELS